MTPGWHDQIRKYLRYVTVLGGLVVCTSNGLAGPHRFALFVGNNQGGAGTRPLEYAVEDARKMHTVLTQIGSIHPEDAVLLSNQSANNVLAAMAAMEGRLAMAKARGENTLFIFYYSGHAKDGALRLGESQMDLATFKNRLATFPADIRIGIIDSCRSGIVNRLKGARKAPAFAIEADGSEMTRGMVLLSSASADEDAQESDELGGSYFSHYLQSGLRGDADQSRDRRITLSEAYTYTYARTVADTADSAAGAQHPTFSYEFKGNADLVLADLIHPHEGIYVPARAPDGIYYFVDHRGFIAAEIQKLPGMDRQIVLAAGTYRVRRRLTDRLRIGEIQVAAQQVTQLEESRLRDAPFSDDPVKGPRSHKDTLISLGIGGIQQSFFDGPVRDDLFPSIRLLAVELTLRNFLRRDWRWGFDLAIGEENGDVNRYGTRLPFQFSEFSFGTSLGPEWPLYEGRLRLHLGMRLALLLLQREFEDNAIPKQFFATFTPGLVGGIHVEIGGGFSLQTRGRCHYLLYNVEENRSLGYWELSAEVQYAF
jgi:hypothetical protein